MSDSESDRKYLGGLGKRPEIISAACRGQDMQREHSA